MLSTILVVTSIPALFGLSKSATWFSKLFITFQVMYTRFHHGVAPPASATKNCLHVDQFYVDFAFPSLPCISVMRPGLNCVQFTTSGSFLLSLQISKRETKKLCPFFAAFVYVFRNKCQNIHWQII